LLVHILCGAVYGDDEAVKTAFYGLPRFFLGQVVGIGGGGGLNTLIVRIFYHIQEIGVQVRLSLEIKDQV